MKCIMIGTAVWGLPYRDLFLNYHLPMLLAPGNILSLRHRIRYLIYTVSDEIDIIGSHPAIIALRDYAEVEFVEVQRPPESEKYAVMCAAQHDLIARGWAEDAGLIYTFPDTVIGDGGFRTVNAIIESGKRAAMSQGFSVNRGPFLKDLEPAMLRDGQMISVSSRAIMHAAMRNMHSRVMGMLWTRPYFTNYPSMMYWELGSHGLLMRAYHLSAVFLHPDKPAHGFRKSFDGDVVDYAVSRWEDIAFINDSDDFGWVEMTDTHDRAFGTKPSVERVAEWAMASGNASRFNQRFLHEKFWHHEGIARSDWASIEAESDAVISAIEALYPRARAGELGNLPKPRHVDWRDGYCFVEHDGLFYSVPRMYGPLEISPDAIVRVPGGYTGRTLDEVKAKVETFLGEALPAKATL